MIISKNILSGIRALHLDKNRKTQQLFIAEGEKVVAELLSSGWPVKLVASVNPVNNDFIHSHPNTAFYEISESDLVKISLLQTPNKMLAVAAIPGEKQPDFNGSDKVILMLDGIRDPGNMGTIIRTADWFGINQVLCSDDCVDVYNPKVVQSSMGSLFRSKVVYGKPTEMIAEARSRGNFRILGASADGTPYSEIRDGKPVLLVIGSESHGLSASVQQLLDVNVGIPRAAGSRAESLNAAVAGAVLMAHFTTALK